MTDTPTHPPSSNAPIVAAGAPVVAVHFLGRTAAFVLGEEAVLLVADKGDEQAAPVHGGGILSAASDGVSVITGGDDGKVFATDAKGESRLIATDAKRRWIDHVASGPDGAVAWSAGKQAFVQAKERAVHRGAIHRRRLGLCAEGRAARDRPLQRRVDVVSERAGGAGIAGMEGLAPRRRVQPERPIPRHRDAGAGAARLARRRCQAHADVRLFRAGPLVRLDHRRQVARDLGLRATRAVAVPGQGRPDGQAAEDVRALGARVTAVACHPKQEVVAAGYADGIVLLVRIDDGAEVLGKKPGDGPVTALGWDAAGTLLAFGTEAGEAGVIDLA